MQIVRVHDHDRRPLLDPYRIGLAIGALLTALRGLFERSAQPRDTSIAWEDGETDARDDQG